MSTPEIPSKISIKLSKKMLEDFRKLGRDMSSIETSVHMAMSYATQANARLGDTSHNLFEQLGKRYKLDLQKCQLKFNPEDNSVTVTPYGGEHNAWAEIVQLLQEFTAKD